MENKSLFSVKDLTIGHEGKILCSGITFDIRKGDCIMLCGANGSGKTTLMKILAGASGSKLTEHLECIMIPARIPKVSGFTLREFIRVSCFSRSDLYGKLSPADEQAIDHAITTLDLNHLEDRDISTLSDGEFQKAGIASALVRKADIIMLDEPTAFLDAENRINVLSTLRTLCDNGQAIIFSTHDLHDGQRFCTKVFALGSDHHFHCSQDSTPESKSDAIARIFS